MDYYDCADKDYGRKGFDKVERKRFPHLKEEERLVPTMEFGFDRAKKEGMQQGLRKGRQQGRQQGKQLGIEQGKQLGIEQGRLDTARHLLLEGVDERIICKAAKLSKRELEEIKRSLDQS